LAHHYLHLLTAHSLCIVGIIRIFCTKSIYFDTYDVTWDSQPMWVWTSVELHGAVVCASAPALKLFFERYLKVGTTQGSSPGSRSDASKALRDAEKGSFALVSQRSETQTQSGGSTYTKSRTIAEELDGPFYGEKMEVEDWEGHGDRRACGITTPCPGHFRSQRLGGRNTTIHDLSSCSWYDE
jgi:hypothetical protein